MTRTAPLLLGLMLLAGCGRSAPDAEAPSAEAEAQARTSAKAVADIEAAEAAAKVPLPAAENRRDEAGRAAQDQPEPVDGAGELAENEAER